LRIKDNQYKHSDDYGSYAVRFGDRTIEVKFVGFLSEQLIEKFCDDLGLMLRVVEWQFWGYYGDLTECDEQSAKTRKVLIELHKNFLRNGCIVDAYNITDPAAIEHVIESRRASGVKQSSIDNNLFPSREQAIEFIHKVLLKVEKIS
jgi:hypothetical protein